jgi:hypothetical protein
MDINLKKNEDIHGNMEFEYLLLRCKLLDDFHGIEYQSLMNIYNKNKKELVDDKDKTYIKNIMNKLDENKSKLNYKNLMACYMAKRVLNWLIKNENNDFTKGLYEFLKKNYYLTKRQIEGVNNWIKNIDKKLEINGKWFYKE